MLADRERNVRVDVLFSDSLDMRSELNPSTRMSSNANLLLDNICALSPAAGYEVGVAASYEKCMANLM